MSVPILPLGSTVIVSVFRPTANSRGIGTTRFLAHTPVGEDVLANAISEKLPALFAVAALPELLLPGAPLIMLLQVLLPDGQLLATSCTAQLNRAAQRSEMLDAWKRDMPAIVGRLLHIVARAIEPAGAPHVQSAVAH
jgi:hypothetical protein